MENGYAGNVLVEEYEKVCCGIVYTVCTGMLLYCIIIAELFKDAPNRPKALPIPPKIPPASVAVPQSSEPTPLNNPDVQFHIPRPIRPKKFPTFVVQDD